MTTPWKTAAEVRTLVCLSGKPKKQQLQASVTDGEDALRMHSNIPSITEVVHRARVDMGQSRLMAFSTLVMLESSVKNDLRIRPYGGKSQNRKRSAPNHE